MGFDASLYVIPKYKNVEYKDINSIEHIIDYDSNPWCKEHFKSAIEYAQSECGDDYRPQSEDVLDFYRTHQTEDEYGHKHLYKDYAYWCSNGSGDIYEFICELGDETSENNCGACRLLSKHDIVEFMNFCLKNVLKYIPQPCLISHAYKYQRDDEGEIPDDADITLFNVDGFEVDFIDEDDNHSLKRVDTNPDWECVFGFPKEYMDEWSFNGYIIGLGACAKILAEVDFENSFVIYNGGW